MTRIKEIKLKKIKIKKGNIFKFLSNKDKFFKKFGELYFSEIKKNKIKGWNFHSLNKCHLAVLIGRVQFKFLEIKKKKIILKKKILSASKYKMIVIPPKVYFCFKGINKHNLIVNFMENSHSKKESKKFQVVAGIKIPN